MHGLSRGVSHKLPLLGCLELAHACTRQQQQHQMQSCSCKVSSQLRRTSCVVFCCCCACRYRALNVQAGTQFCDGGFEGEVAAGRISSGSLDKFSCVALAGTHARDCLQHQIQRSRAGNSQRSSERLLADK